MKISYYGIENSIYFTEDTIELTNFFDEIAEKYENFNVFLNKDSFTKKITLIIEYEQYSESAWFNENIEWIAKEIEEGLTEEKIEFLKEQEEVQEILDKLNRYDDIVENAYYIDTLLGYFVKSEEVVFKVFEENDELFLSEKDKKEIISLFEELAEDKKTALETSKTIIKYKKIVEQNLEQLIEEDE